MDSEQLEGAECMMFIVLILVLAVGDLGIKWLIEKQKPEQFPRPLGHTGGKILLYRNHNAGFPFGFMEKYGEIVRTVPLVVISALTGAFCCLLKEKDKTVQKLGMAMMLGGALSNLYDRFVRRYVVDYFSIQVGALKKVVFNLGDIFVFAGSGILLALEILKEIRTNLHK